MSGEERRKGEDVSMCMNTASKIRKSTQRNLSAWLYTQISHLWLARTILVLRRVSRHLPVELLYNCSPNFRLAWKPTPWSKRQTWLTVASLHMPSMGKIKKNTSQHCTSGKMSLNPKRQRGGLGRPPHFCLNLVYASWQPAGSMCDKSFCHWRQQEGCLLKTYAASTRLSSRKFLKWLMSFCQMHRHACTVSDEVMFQDACSYMRLHHNSPCLRALGGP